MVLVHGNGGATGQDHWQPWVKAQLEMAGIRCDSPDMPDPVKARASYWLPYLEELGCDHDTVIVGHSSGAIAAMRYAENHRIRGSVLVGTYFTDLDDKGERESGYFDSPWDWYSIRSNQKWVAVFASSDDPYIDIAEPRLVAKELDAEMHEYTNRGHFMDGRHAVEFPELVKLLLAKLGD